MAVKAKKIQNPRKLKGLDIGPVSRTYQIMALVIITVVVLIISGIIYIIVSDQSATSLEVNATLDEADILSYDATESDIDDDFVIDQDSLAAYDVTVVEEEVQE